MSKSNNDVDEILSRYGIASDVKFSLWGGGSPIREIPLGKVYRLYKRMDKSLEHMWEKIMVDVSSVEMPKNMKLSNLPVTTELARMQQYRFGFSKDDLDRMFGAQKVIVDTYHHNFINYDERYGKTLFYMVAPELVNTGLPELYRFSVMCCKNEGNPPAHYSLAMHAIVGGMEDGYLFMARLDNNASKNAEHVVYPTKPMLKSKNRVKQVENIHVKLPEVERIAFPHLHKAVVNKSSSEPIEGITPKHLKSCENKTFRENVEFMMGLCGICNSPQIFTEDTSISEILKSDLVLSKLSPCKNHNGEYICRRVEELEFMDQEWETEAQECMSCAYSFKG